MNPFTAIPRTFAWGPGSFEMALPLIEALDIRRGDRVLEVGAGSGWITVTLARHWEVSVFTLEPWHGGEGIQELAEREGVGDRVVALTSRAQDLPFAAATFDTVMGISSFEMIGDDRPRALEEMARVAKPGARVGIAEPMCLPDPIPPEIAELDERGQLQFQHCFRTLDWNRELFEDADLSITASYYFPDAQRWWTEYAEGEWLVNRDVQRELIARDEGRWLSLGLVVGEKRCSCTTTTYFRDARRK